MRPSPEVEMDATQQRVWDVIEERIDAAPSDGIAADGQWNVHVQWQQKGFIDGMRAARLAALSVLVGKANEAEPFLTRRGWENLSCDDQYRLARQIASNVGYILTPEPSIQAADDAPATAIEPTGNSGELPTAAEIKALDEWSEDDGNVVWWCWRDGAWLGEPAYIGSPLDLGHTVEVTVAAHNVDKLMRVMVGGWPGYHTHWTPHPTLPPPPLSEGSANQGTVTV